MAKPRKMKENDDVIDRTSEGQNDLILQKW